MIDYIISTSCGNDSVAMLQFFIENYKGSKIVAIYCNTGWSSQEWPDRVMKYKEKCEENGIDFFETQSEIGGMAEWSEKKSMFPMIKKKWCTEKLKIEPFLALADKIDPEKKSTICIGVRREESFNRKDFPEFSKDKSGREKWAPLVAMKESDRNDLIVRAGFEVLPHRSRECAPCIHSSRKDLRLLSEFEIKRLEDLEKKMGGYFFNPSGRMGAEGIREVVQWSQCDKGQYIKGAQFLSLRKKEIEEENACSSGFCGG